ncbi:hypothetical protein R84B8_01431 [Treponema sp. R8-4-B8]
MVTSSKIQPTTTDESAILKVGQRCIPRRP